MSGRAYRRHQQERAKRRARRYVANFVQCQPDQFTDRLVRCFASDRTPCSCAMCGNPRKWFGEVTRQEKLAEVSCVA